MKTIYKNGTIYTANSEAPFVEALVVDGERIAFAGDLVTAEAQVSADANVVDLAGRMLMPGIHDAHTHLMMSGLKHLYEYRLTPFADAEAITRELLAAHSPSPDGDACCDWVVGGEVFPPSEDNEEHRLTRKQLDKVFPDDPVYLHDYSCHHGVVNSKALELAGIEETDEFGHGGLYRRDEDGRLTGELIEEATWKVLNARPLHSPETYRDAVEWAMGQCHKFGVTSVQEASAAKPTLQAFRDLERDGKLKLNVAAHLVWRNEGFGMGTKEELDELLQDHESWASTHVDTRFVKIWTDGAPLLPIETHSPLMAEGEVDGSWLLVSEVDLAEVVGRFDASGRTVKIHCAGAGAVRSCIRAIEKVRAINGPGQMHEVAHAGFVADEDYERFQEANVTAEMSPALWHVPEYGLGEGFKFEKMLRHGIRMTIGTDWLISPTPNLFPGIQGAVQHATHPINLETALEAVTRVGAEAVGQKHKRGTLQRGKSADFIVLDRDLFSIATDEVGDTVVTETFVEGERVYEASFDNMKA